MRVSLADLKRAKKSKKRNASENESTRPQQAVAKRPCLLSADPPPRTEDEEVGAGMFAFPPSTMNTALDGSSPVPAEVEASTREARRKGKAPIVISDQEEAELPEDEWIRFSYQVPRDSTAIRNKSLAEKIIRSIILPQDREERKARPLEENVRSFYSGLVKFMVDISIIQDGVAGFSEYIRKLQEQVDDAKADAEVAEERRKAGEIREVTLQEEVRTLQARDHKKDQKIRDLEDKLAFELEQANQLRSDLQEADNQTKEAKEQVESIRSDLRRSQTAATRAVDDFRLSTEYLDEIAENCLGSLHLGFEECKKKVATAFPSLNLDQIVESDEEDSGGENGAEESTPPGPSVGLSEPVLEEEPQLLMMSKTIPDLEVEDQELPSQT